jgi:MFS family permease
MGLATAAGSMGQFLFAPLGQSFISAYGPTTALVLLSCALLIVPVLARSLIGKGDDVDDPADEHLSARQALRGAFAHPSYLLLTSGFFVCGFHIAFISVHLPPYLSDQGMSKGLAAWALSLIGLFNVIGAYTSGILGGQHPRRLLLSGIYLARGLAFAIFLVVPVTTATVLVFAALIGLLWLSTVPLTSGLIALMFGTRHIGMLFGVVFLSHQVGAFVGALLGGSIYESTGSYDLMWVLCIALSVFAGIVHLPIRERRAPVLVPSPA